MGLRDEQRELTRRKILGAVLGLVADGSLGDLSIPAVSRRSGVSVATIYRYFPTKDDLLAAAAAEPREQASRSARRLSRREGDDDLAHHVREMWHEFGDNLPLLRHQLSTEAGRTMRRARVAENRRRLADYVEGFGIDPSSEAGERLIAMIMVVAGSVALIELHDNQGLTIEESIDHSQWALGALIEAAGGEMSPSPTESNRAG